MWWKPPTLLAGEAARKGPWVLGRLAAIDHWVKPTGVFRMGSRCTRRRGGRKSAGQETERREAQPTCTTQSVQSPSRAKQTRTGKAHRRVTGSRLAMFSGGLIHLVNRAVSHTRMPIK